MKRTGLIFLLVLVFLLLPYSAFADTWEYYTYGGYNAVVDAWRRVGLIFSDRTFTGLYFSVIILGIIILYFMVLARATLAGAAKFNLAGWAIPVLLGASIYIAFIVPKDRIVVYDTVLNRGPETIGNIPRIMAMTAGLLNKIEKGMIDIVRVSSSPVEDYARNAGGTGFVILSQFGDPATISLAGVPMYVHQTAYQFIKDCLVFELGREGTLLTAQDINSGKIDFATAIQRAENPGVPTVYYADNGSEVSTIHGYEVTCEAAGEILKSYIIHHKDAVIASTCAMSGYNVDVPSELNACKTLVESTFKDGLAGATGRSGNLDLLAAQAFFAQSLINTLNSINPESSIKLMATKEAASQYLGLAIHANTWLPVIKETLRAVAIAISPFVLLFAATPLVGRALGFILGMMVWVVTWTVIDAILHYAAVSQAVAASKEFTNVITNGTPGTMFFVLLPSYSSKVAAVFGAIRWAGLGLATVLTGMLIKFGGAALAMVAGSITGAAQSAGAAMGRMVADVTSPIRADLVPTASWTNAAVAAGGVSALAGGMIESQAGSLWGQARAGSYLGAGQIAQSTFLSNIKSVAENLALGSAEMAWRVGTVAGETAVGGALGTLTLAAEHRKSVKQLSKEKVLGIQYSHGVVQSPLVRVVETPDGYRVDKVDTQVLSASVKQLEQESYQVVYEKLQQALKKMDYSELVRIYRDYKHIFSKSDRDAIEAAIKAIEERNKVQATKSSEEKAHTDYTENKQTLTTSAKLTIGTEVKEEVNAGIPGIATVGEKTYARAEASVEGSSSSSTGSKDTTTKKSSKETEEAQKEALATTLAQAFMHVLEKQDVNTVGKAFEKIFRNDKEFAQVMKAAEQYKEARTLESAIAVNALPLIVQKLGDRDYSQYDVKGLDSRYDMVVRELTAAVHSKDPEKLKKFTNAFQEVQNELKKGEFDNVSKKGEEVKKDATKEIKNTYNELDQQPERPKGMQKEELSGPVVHKKPQDTQNIPRPKQPKKTLKSKKKVK